MAVGITYILFGVYVYRFPVPITISALIIYLALQAVQAALEPESLAKGFIIKILIIVALAKSIQAAIAYEAERKREAQERPPLDEFQEEPL